MDKPNIHTSMSVNEYTDEIDKNRDSQSQSSCSNSRRGRSERKKTVESPRAIDLSGSRGFNPRII